MTEEQNDTQTAIEAGLALGQPRIVGDTPVMLVPVGTTVLDLEKHLPAPTRKRGNVTLRTVDSFVRYVLMEKADATRIYASVADARFTAVFNDHHSTPGWRDYRAGYSCPASVEWETWKASDGKRMNQEEFAQFIEDNVPDVVQPPAAEMLEISRTLEAKKKVNFASGLRLSNGQNELTYEESISGTAGKGKFVVPEEFVIGIPVFEGGQRYAVTARLRYRIAEGGRLSMWYELVRPHKILEDAVTKVLEEITVKTGVPVLEGSV